jgi:hypothetical protein
VEAPDGTAARPRAPPAKITSASTVGLPRESMISLAKTPTIAIAFAEPLPLAVFPDFWRPFWAPVRAAAARDATFFFDLPAISHLPNLILNCIDFRGESTLIH